MPTSGSALISAPMRTFSVVAVRMVVIGPIAERPARIASQIECNVGAEPANAADAGDDDARRIQFRPLAAISARVASTMSPTFFRLLQASTVFISISMP